MSQSKVYVGGLSYNTTEDGLREAFLRFGDIEDLIIITDKYTGRSKGFGFITFNDQKGAEGALEMNGQKLDGRTIKVSIAKEKRADDRTTEGSRRW